MWHCSRGLRPDRGRRGTVNSNNTGRPAAAETAHTGSILPVLLSRWHRALPVFESYISNFRFLRITGEGFSIYLRRS